MNTCGRRCTTLDGPKVCTREPHDDHRHRAADGFVWTHDYGRTYPDTPKKGDDE